METDTDLREAEFQTQVEVLLQRYLEGLPARRTLLMEAWHDCADEGDEAPWQQLHEAAHKLSGSAPCYGFEALGQAARNLDALLSEPCRARARACTLVESLLLALDAVIASG